MADFRDGAAIDFLASAANAEDAGASSHWRQMHSAFSYRDGQFTGLRGFGGYSPAPGLLRRSAHHFLQRPFRTMGTPLSRFREADEAAARLTLRQDRAYDLDALRQALTAALLVDRAAAYVRPGATVAVIGDGFGFLASLLHSLAPGLRTVSVNLTRTLLVDLVFLRRALPEATLGLATSAEGVRTLLADLSIDCLALQAEHSGLLAGIPVDLAVNVVSMQEMNPPVIASYFSALRASPGPETAFYCCNRLEKRLPDGTTVRFHDYPWRTQDRILLDELCPWNQHFYTWRPPFHRPYDGPIWHRLALLDKSK